MVDNLALIHIDCRFQRYNAKPILSDDFGVTDLPTSVYREQRVRDPVHGLILFTASGPQSRVDQTAWQLLNTPEFQRLRRIRQLGVTEFTFPGATHTRFAHSIGVFHTARRLSLLIKQSVADPDFDSDRASTAVLAALLHDVGHGPFSHAFETVQKQRGVEKRHEKWTSEIIRNRDGKIFPILNKFRNGIADEIADLLAAENPTDEYHAIVSSSFDADRLDYLRRDRLMTGSGAGAIDFDWLMDNIRIAEVNLGSDDEEEGPAFKTFCLSEKALQAAEAFLLARYWLFEQVYLHKTTRGVETILRRILEIVAEAAETGDLRKLDLDENDPFIRFFRGGGETLENYLRLDDFAAWALLSRLAACSDRTASGLAERVRDRRLLKCIDINSTNPIKPGEEMQALESRRQILMSKIEANVGEKLGKSVFRDAEPISVYGEVGGDDAKKHKKLSIQLKDGTTREITQLSPAIRTLVGKRSIVRYFCATDSERRGALKDVVQ